MPTFERSLSARHRVSSIESTATELMSLSQESDEDGTASKKQKTQKSWDQQMIADLEAIMQTCRTGNTVCEMQTDAEGRQRIHVNKEACTRNLEDDYGVFVVTVDLYEGTGAKGSLIFHDFDDFCHYYESLDEFDRHFYVRNHEHKGMRMCFDIDGLVIGEEFIDVETLVDELCNALTEFCKNSPHVLPGSPEIEVTNFAVYTCPKRNKEGAELFSVHIHDTANYFSTPRTQRTFMQLFVDYCKTNYATDFGIDCSIYNNAHSLRLPGCCKFDGKPPRVLVPFGDSPTGRDALRVALLVEPHGADAMRMKTTAAAPAPAGRTRVNRHGTTVPDLRPDDGAAAARCDPAVLRRTKDRLAYMLQLDSFSVLDANEHRIIWKNDEPFECARCNRTHENNTNFRTMVYTDGAGVKRIGMLCFQTASHAPMADWSVDLGLLNPDQHCFTFDPSALMHIIHEVTDECTELRELEKTVKRLERESQKVAREPVEPVDCPRHSTDWNLNRRAKYDEQRARFDAQQDEHSGGLEEAKARIEELKPAIDAAQHKAVQYVSQFYVKCNIQRGFVFRLRFERSEDEDEDDKIVGIEQMANSISGFIQNTTKGLFETFTFTGDTSGNVFKLWMDSQDVPLYNGMGYYPDGSPLVHKNPDFLNTWKGMAFTHHADYLSTLGVPFEEIPGRYFPATMQIIRDRTEYGCDEGLNEQTQFFTYWINALLTQPGKPLPIMNVLMGGMGTGKSLITTLLSKLVGLCNYKEVTGLEHLFGKWNDHLLNKLLFVVAEIGLLTSRARNPDQEVEHELKKMLDGGGGRKEVRAKFQSAAEADMTMWVVGCSNNEFCVEVDMNERRKNPIDGTRNETPHRYYVQMVREIESLTTLKVIFHWFSDPRNAAPGGPDAFFRDPSNLPQTPYVCRLKSAHASGALPNAQDALDITETLNKLFFTQLLKSIDDVEESQVELFPFPLLSMDEHMSRESLVPIAQGDVRGPTIGEETCYFVEGDAKTPSYIRVPSRLLWGNVMGSQRQGIRGAQGLVKSLIGRNISQRYRDWYKQVKTSQTNRINGECMACFIIPYGAGGSELKLIGAAVLDYIS